MKRIIVALAIAIGVFATATAEADPGSIAVEHAWARATPKGAVTGAGYVTLVNNGTSDDRLLGATSPIATTIQFHSESSENGVMKMAQLPALDLHPGQPVVLKPSGIHMMMLGLKQQLQEGQSFPLTLTFEQAGSVEVTVRIGKVGAMDDPGVGAGG